VPTEPDTASDGAKRVVIIAARDEADRIEATCAALLEAFPGAHLVLAESGSKDATAELAKAAGAEVVRTASPRSGKGGSATSAARAVLASGISASTVVLLCDGDLGASASKLGPLVVAVEGGECDLAVAAFSRRVGGGFGAAVGFARWAIRRLTGVELRAPISGQRALRAELLERLLPFAGGFGMETAMTIDALRAGCRVKEIELDLEHRATTRSVSGFAHRARQLLDFVGVYLSRRYFGRR
jgi:glycosyltransferase involved in cell wall biosynthesis